MELLRYIIIFIILKFETYGHLMVKSKSKMAKPLVLSGSYASNIVVDMGIYDECIIHFPTSSSKYPYTVFVWSNTYEFEYPILVTVRQQRSATSWELPLTVHSKLNTFKFFNTSRTLCHNHMDLISRIPRNNIGNKKFDLTKELSISLATYSEDIIPVTVRVEEPENFYLEEHIQYSINISPSEPRFYYYKFPQRKNEDFSTTVILDVESEDEICLTVSIQNASCPVYDLNPVISFRGKYQTIDTKGGIIVKISADLTYMTNTIRLSLMVTLNKTNTLVFLTGHTTPKKLICGQEFYIQSYNRRFFIKGILNDDKYLELLETR